MAQYLLTFTGKISWEGQSNGLPPEIYAYILYEGEDISLINKLIEDQGRAFIQAQAMFVQRDQHKVIDLRQTPADRMAVPFRWIVYIAPGIKKLTGELSSPDEHGTERLADGSEPIKQ